MRRRAAVVLALALPAMPASAVAQDQCRLIRALTNADGRNFADLSLGVGRNPYRMSVRARGEELSPAPENCDVSADADDVSFSCTWRPGDYAAASTLFDQLLGRFQQCLGGQLAAPSGPEPYGDALAIRQSETELRQGTGETSLALFLIEARQTEETTAYNYITLSVSHAHSEPDYE